SDSAGDGTTTATVLAQAIVREGAKAVAAGMNPMDLKRGIDLAVEAVVANLEKVSKKVSTNAEIAQVGTISANNDREIGEGMQFDRGYMSPYFITNAEKMIVELADPYILLHDKKLSGLQAILPL